ncbi:hypothetical protein [Actinomadura sp. GC306]|uniref:hypothetical protein n=1 Tax=Actinomadura sp. GC306 TaxID=2530367 RepID=UPI001404EC8E|nr:hypothetical protein [Actinomadura sp. GC306]
MGGVLVPRRVLRLALLVLVLRRRELLVLRLPELVLRLAVLLILGRLPELLVLGLAVLLLGRRRAPLVLLGLLRQAPRVAARGLLRHGRLAAAVLRLPPVLAALLAPGLARRLAVLVLAVLRLPVLGLPVLGLAVLRLAVLGLPVLRLSVRVGQGRCAPRVRLAGRCRRLLRRAPRVLRLTGRARLVRGLVLRRLLLVGIVLRCLLVGLAVLPRARGAVLLAALGTALRRVSLPLVVVPARRLLPVGAAAPGARQIRPAAHAEQVARLERLVTDRTFQGRHDTSPERTPARSSLDVR